MPIGILSILATPTTSPLTATQTTSGATAAPSFTAGPIAEATPSATTSFSSAALSAHKSGGHGHHRPEGLPPVSVGSSGGGDAHTNTFEKKVQAPVTTN